MPFEQYIETLDPVLMHAGENAPHAYFIPFDADQDARGARESSRRFTLLNGQWEFKYYPSVRDFTADFTEKRIHGILGKSGCGKSTL